MKYKYLLLVLAIPLSSCQKFYEFQILMPDGKLIFDHSEFVTKCTGGLLIKDFGIEFEGVDQSEVAWMLVRDEKTNMSKRVFDIPLIYGTEIDGTITRTNPIPLKMGKYNIGATLACITSEKIEPLTFLGSFHIDENGSLVSKKEAE